MLLAFFGLLLLCARCQNDLPYSIQITILDNQHWPLAGMLVTITQGGHPLTSREQTNSQGLLEKTGKMQKQSSYTIQVVVQTQFDGPQQSLNLEGILTSTGSVQFSARVAFPDPDISPSDNVRLCWIQSTAFSQGDKKKLPGVEVAYKVIYVQAGQEKFITFKGISDANGLISTRFWIPQVMAVVVLYEAGKDGYWNTVQNDQNAQNFMLSPNNKFQLNFQFDLATGVIKYVVSGLVVDEKTQQNLQGVKLTVQGKNVVNGADLPAKNMLTKADGKLDLIFELPVFKKFHLKYAIEKENYLTIDNEYDLEVDLNNKVDSIRKDLGTIKLMQSLGQLTISGTVTDDTKVVPFVEGAQLSIQFGQNQNPVLTTTNAQGKYTVLLHTPINEVLKIVIQIKAKGFVDKQTDPKEITVPKSNQPASLAIDAAITRVKVPITISDIVINKADNKPVPNATVKVLASAPPVKDSKLYNQPVLDKTDGSVQLKFECYEAVKFTATLEYSVPTFVPYTYTTPQLDCKEQNIGSTPITLSKETATLNLKGDVKDINSQPLKNLQLTIKVTPDIQIPNPKVTTDAKGEWTISGLTIVPRTEYNFEISYENGIKQITQVPFKYQATTDKVQNAVYPTIFFRTLIKASVGGAVTTPQGKLSIPVPITITCDTLGKDGKPLVIQTKTNPDGTYKAEFEALGEAGKPFTCTVSSGQSPSVQPFTGKVSVSSPKWSGDGQINANYNSIDVVVKGKATGLVDGKPLEGVAVTLTLTPHDVFIQPTGKHVLEHYMRKKRHREQPTHSELSTKSAKDGTYSFSFKAITGVALSADITAKLDSFDDFSKKGIAIPATKSDTFVQDLAMDRQKLQIVLKASFIGSDKKPIQSTTVAISKTDPLIKDSKSYNVPVKGDNNGVALLKLECYKGVEYTATLKVDVPTFLEKVVDTQKFVCLKPEIVLTPIELKLEKVTLLTIMSGKALNPFGKPQAGLAVTLTTKPESATLQATTQADGTWTISDPKINPNQEYVGTITYQNINKAQQTIEQKFTVQTANQKIQFPDIHYMDIVNAKITGAITLEKGAITQPVNVHMSCPKTKSQSKETVVDFQTDKTGQITQTFKIEATYDETIVCTLTPQTVVEKTPTEVKLLQPTYEAKVTIKTKFLSTKVSLSGLVSDMQKLVEKLPNIPIKVTLAPADPLAENIQSKTGPDGKYLIEFDTIRGISYEATITVDGSPQFKVATQKVSLATNSEKVAQTKDFQLDRVIVDCTIKASLSGSWNPEANVEILKSIPQMANKNLYNKPVVTKQGAFSFPFQCYAGMQTTLEMDMWSEVYPKTILPPQEFTCGPAEVQFKPITVTSKSVQITLSGVVKDLTGVISTVSDVTIEVVLTPKDPLASSLTVRSAADGKYQLIFGAVQGQSYTAVVKASHPDFQPFTSPALKLDSSKSNAITQDISIDRQVIKATVTTTLTDAKGTALPSPKVTAEGYAPAVKGHEKDPITGTGDAKGVVKLGLQCYKNVKESMVLDVQAPGYRPCKSDKLSFTCSGAEIGLGTTKVTAEKAPTTTKLQAKGVVIGPEGKGQPNVVVTLTSEPQTQQAEAKTDKDGKYTINTDKLELKKQYTLHFSVANADGSKSEVTKAFQTADENSNVEAPQLSFADFLKTKVSGVAATEGMPAALLPITLSSAAIGRDKKALNLQKATSENGKFEFDVEYLAHRGQKAKMTLSSGKTSKFDPSTMEVEVDPAERTKEVHFGVKANAEFRALLDKYYQEIAINGQVVGWFKCGQQVKSGGLEGVEVTVKQWDGMSYQVLDLRDTTDENGYYSIEASILKTKLYNQMLLEFKKEKYIGQSLLFNPYMYQRSTGDKIDVEMTVVSLVYFGGEAPCPPA